MGGRVGCGAATDSHDEASWSNAVAPMEERARARGRVTLLLVCGQGRWEDATGSLESTLRFAERLGEKDIRHELDVWGHDVPHDWPSWRAQIAHHLPRFC